MTRADVPEPGGADTVFFLSDYGRRDEFVGVVHAVLRRLAPWVVVVDLTHDVPPFDVRAGADTLARAFPHLGSGVVLAVVDPGVGSSRRAVALSLAGSGPGWLVGPDNGLLLAAARAGGVTGAIELGRTGGGRAARSGGPVTFDGRDLFAPTVAALCAGADPATLGSPLDPSSLVLVAPPVLETGAWGDGRRWLRVEVTWVDRFGNVQLAADGDAVPGSVDQATAGPADGEALHPVRRVRAFADLSPGEPGLIADGNGRLALVVREASAAEHFAVAAGDLVKVVW